jgi:hypothetical protein
VRYFESLDCKAITDLNKTSRFSLSQRQVPTFSEPLKRNKSNTVILVCQIRPYNIVEDVGFYGVDGKWKTSKAFCFTTMLQSRSVYCKSRKVIQVRMCD